MKTRYRLIRRGVRNGAYYCVDKKTAKRTSLQTDDEDVALQIVEAKNQAQRQPVLNLQIAKAYLAGTDSAICVGAGTILFFLLFQNGGPLSAVPMILAGGAALMAVVGIASFKETASHI